MNEAIWAFFGVIAGTSGLAIVNKYLNRGKDKFDFASQIRDELREDIKGYREEVQSLRKEVVDWKNKYYALLEANWK